MSKTSGINRARISTCILLSWAKLKHCSHFCLMKSLIKIQTFNHKQDPVFLTSDEFHYDSYSCDEIIYINMYSTIEKVGSHK